MRLTPEQQEVCNALNRRTEFRVLRTTYGLYDKSGQPTRRTATPTPPPSKKADSDELEYVE